MDSITRSIEESGRGAWKEVWKWFSDLCEEMLGLNGYEWMVVFGIVLFLAIMAMRGFGSRKTY